jgi:hypothetical protein
VEEFQDYKPRNKNREQRQTIATFENDFAIQIIGHASVLQQSNYGQVSPSSCRRIKALHQGTEASSG